MKTIRSIRSVIFNLHFLLFINGFLIAGFLFCGFQADYENRLFASFALDVHDGKERISQDSILKKAIHSTFYILEERSKIFVSQQTGGFLDNVIHPVSADMMTAEGACGSYSTVLCKLLSTMGFITRFAQMKVDGLYGGHIVVEVKTSYGWAVLDPKYNLFFTKPDGALASFNDVANDWDLYKKQLPAGYNLHYKYQGVQYTNWNKIPVLMPALRKMLSLFIGEDQLQQLCLRSYFLNKYNVCGNILLTLIIPISLFIIVKAAKLKFSSTIKIQDLNKRLNEGIASLVNA